MCENHDNRDNRLPEAQSTLAHLSIEQERCYKEYLAAHERLARCNERVMKCVQLIKILRGEDTIDW